MPRLEMVEEPPWYSSGLSFRARARAAMSFISFEIADSAFISARRITGVIRPPSSATATAMSHCCKRRMRSCAHTALAAGTRGGLDIARHDAAVRTGRRNGGEIDASFRREPARQRRHTPAAGQPRRTVIALRRAHLEERIELYR